MLHFAAAAASPSSPAQAGWAGSINIFCTNTDGPYVCGENTSLFFGMVGGLAPAENRFSPQLGFVARSPWGSWLKVFGVPSCLPGVVPIPWAKIRMLGFTALISP